MENIRRVQLLHNPGAGSGSITKERLSAVLNAAGWHHSYSSTKESWEIDATADLIVVAGGDGTIRKITEAALELPESPLIAVLPMGTANNIATSLGIHGDIREIIEDWKNGETAVLSFDSGIVNNPVVSDFFIEGVGFGIFPKMISNMKDRAPDGATSPDENIKTSLEEMYDTCKEYKPRNCSITIDGKDYSDDMLMVEIMNIRSVGPNVFFAPEADLSDGRFDIVIAKAGDRKPLKNYFKAKINQDRDEYPLPIIHGKNISITWDGKDFHLDDSLIDIEKASEIDISINKKKLRFLVPN